jgi:outer membrane protein assembly factor BamB
MVSGEVGLPNEVGPGTLTREGDSAKLDRSTARHLKWAAPLGMPGGSGVCYTSPAVAGGRVYIGCDGSIYDERFIFPKDYFRKPMNGRRKRAALLCLDEATGRFLWQYNIPANNYASIPGGAHRTGVCATPAVEGDRLYFTGYQNEVICADVRGQADGNQGPFLDEKLFLAQLDPADIKQIRPLQELKPTDVDIIWMYHIPRELGIRYDAAAASSPLVHNGRVYVGTNIGVADGGPKDHKESLTPDGPALIVLDEKTGRLLATEDEGIARRVQHGSWSPPSLVSVNGKPLVVFGGGDRFVYAFDPEPRPGRARRYPVPRWEAPGSEILPKFAGDAVTIPAEVGILKCVWKFDANGDNTASYTWRGSNMDMPGAVIGTPVVWENRVFVNVGVDWAYRCRGLMSCYDATGTGDISKTGRVWLCDDIERSCSTPAVHDGLVYTGDYTGKVRCVDAATGQLLWSHPMRGAIHGSPLVADGKVYIGSSGGDLAILRAGRELRVLCSAAFPGKIESTPVAANGVLYVPTSTMLFAFQRQDARRDGGNPHGE